jgi:hypothetical protein
MLLFFDKIRNVEHLSSITFFARFHTHALPFHLRNATNNMMNETLLCETLGALTPDEQNQLKKALLSPLFNPSRLASKCAELYLFLQQKGFGQPISYQEAFKSIYPNKPFNKALLENVMSALMDCVRELIAWQQVRHRNGATGQRLEMARFYRERRLSHRFEAAIDQARRELKKQTSTLSAASQFQEFQIEKEIYDYRSIHNDLQNDLNLPATADSFIQYSLVQGLELALRLAHQAKLTSLEFGQYNDLSNRFLGFAKTTENYRNNLVELLCLGFQLLNVQTTETVFQRFNNLFIEAVGNINFQTSQFLATIARHFCLEKINHGRAEYRKVLFGLYKSHLGQGLLYENGKILHNTLLNIVSIAVGENEGTWGEAVLESHRYSIIGCESQESSYFFIKSVMYFNQKDFQEAGLALDEAFFEIKKVEARNHFKDFNLKLMARKLEIQILYENDPYSTLLNDRLNAHKMFVHRSRHLTTTHKTLHNNFVDLMKQLISPNRQKMAKKLNEKLQSPGFLIADRRWVTEKVAALVADNMSGAFSSIRGVVRLDKRSKG